MNIPEKHLSTLKELLAVEHSAVATKLQFIDVSYNVIDESLLIKSIGLLDELSRSEDERLKKVVVTVSAILWTYKDEDWGGLSDYLILVLNRIGFPPSAIMIDKDYDFDNAKLSGLDSLINELSISVHQFKHEIFINGQKLLTTDFQKRVWDKLNTLSLLGISAPTSAGKSFIILMKSIDELLKKGGNIVYIVPTLSLVAQVASDFHQQLRRFGLDDYRVLTTYNAQFSGKKRVYVLTQERALSAFSQKEIPFEDVRILIVDEIQNIERVEFEGDQRAKTLYDTLIEFRHTCNAELTIISGPRIEGLKELGCDIFDEENIDEEKTKGSPVASFTYSVSKSGNFYFLNQYTDILTTPNKIRIVNDSMIKGYGKSQYQDDFVEYLSSFITSLGRDSINIIFSPTAGQARKTAIKLANLRTESNTNENISSLEQYLKDTVHSDYEMCNTISKGVVYHHGKTPTHVRAVIEKAIKAKMINNIVCTTTLLQGVNLPAQNVIVRNPDLAIKSKNGTKPKLTDYEIANLRGRAGRLLKDFIGRTYVLEEKAFESSNQQLDLFPEAEKTLKAGYGDKFTKFKSEIKKSIEKHEAPSEDNKEFSFLVTHIRQTVIKHGNSSINRLKSVGINISQDEYQAIALKMNELQVPKGICILNRYWDPLDLDLLYKNRNRFNLPTSASSSDIDYQLQQALTLMKELLPLYYYKYFSVNENLLGSACISAKEWLKEKSLKRILNSAYFNDSDKVEQRISLLQNTISYGLPMLLKPIYDILNPDNMFLRFIEIGAYMPVTRKMIELNIPRETAIYINDNHFSNLQQSENEELENTIISKLIQIKDELGYWYRVQLEGII
jgi:hypothetical protein